MSGFAALSINEKRYPSGQRLKIAKRGREWREVPQMVWDLFWATHFGQLRGGAYCGLVTASIGDADTIDLRTHRGAFRNRFENDLVGLGGNIGIGHVSDSNKQPYNVEQSRFGRFVLCFDGNIINRQELIDQILAFGSSLPRDDDVGVLAHLIGLGKDMADGIRIAAERIHGTFALAILTPEGLYVALSPDGHKPAVIGQKEGAVLIASETCQFQTTGFKLVRDVEPGEILFVHGDEVETVATLPAQQIQGCSFCGVYTGYVTSTIFGVPVSRTRRRLGAKHAERDIEAGFIPDIVIGVPESGRFGALGCKMAWDIALMAGIVKRTPFYYELLTRFPHARRSFGPSTQAERNLEAWTKLLPVSESILEILEQVEGLIEAKLAASGGQKIVIDIVVCDDSIVRGTQTENDLIPKIMSLKGYIESKFDVEIRIHFRISNPPLLSCCLWGKSTKEGDNLAAVNESGQQRAEEEIAERLGAASVKYNTIQDLADAHGIPLEDLCVDCDCLPAT